jgi:hypothetical protein
MRTLLLVLLLFQLYLKEGLQPIQLSYDVGENWEDSLGGPPCFVNMYNHKVLGETLITMKKKIFMVFDLCARRWHRTNTGH